MSFHENCQPNSLKSGSYLPKRTPGARVNKHGGSFNSQLDYQPFLMEKEPLQNRLTKDLELVEDESLGFAKHSEKKRKQSK